MSASEQEKHTGRRMASIDNGGPAFPKTGNFNVDQITELDSQDKNGMTLLDHFAGIALLGFLTKPDMARSALGALVASRLNHPMALAKSAYDQAAAMLIEKRRRESAEEASNVAKEPEV